MTRQENDRNYLMAVNAAREIDIPPFVKEYKLAVRTVDKAIAELHSRAFKTGRIFSAESIGVISFRANAMITVIFSRSRRCRKDGGSNWIGRTEIREYQPCPVTGKHTSTRPDGAGRSGSKRTGLTRADRR